MVKKNECFRQGLINLFFEGSTVPFLAKTLPLFELKKLSISKLSFELPGLIDTIIRYKEKGSYSGRRENNAESAIKAILDKHEITYSNGDLGSWLQTHLTVNEQWTLSYLIKQIRRLLLKVHIWLLLPLGKETNQKRRFKLKPLRNSLS